MRRRRVNGRSEGIVGLRDCQCLIVGQLVTESVECENRYVRMRRRMLNCM